MSLALGNHPPAAPLAPVSAALRAMFGTDDLPGLVPGLLVADETGWVPASRLVDGSGLPELLDAAGRRWRAAPHVVASLAWKSYTYWLTLPAVLGWAAARRIPLLYPADVLIRSDDHGPLITLGLRRSAAVAVLASDPLAGLGRPGVRVVADEVELLRRLRASLLDSHLIPLLGAVRTRVHVGARTLLGSVAAAAGYAILRAAAVLPEPPARTVGTLLSALGIDDLIELVPEPAGGLAVRRRTCCLAFALPRPKICADCCLRQS